MGHSPNDEGKLSSESLLNTSGSQRGSNCCQLSLHYRVAVRQ